MGKLVQSRLASALEALKAIRIESSGPIDLLENPAATLQKIHELASKELSENKPGPARAKQAQP